MRRVLVCFLEEIEDSKKTFGNFLTFKTQKQILLFPKNFQVEFSLLVHCDIPLPLYNWVKPFLTQNLYPFMAIFYKISLKTSCNDLNKMKKYRNKIQHVKKQSFDTRNYLVPFCTLYVDEQSAKLPFQSSVAVTRTNERVVVCLLPNYIQESNPLLPQ